MHWWCISHSFVKSKYLNLSKSQTGWKIPYDIGFVLSGVAFQGRAAPIWPKSRAGCVIWPRPIISPGNVVITAVMPDHSRTNLWRRDHPGTATGYNTTSYWVISLPESFQPLSHWVTQGHWVICHCTWLGNSESSDYWRTNLEGSTTITHFVGKKILSDN